MPKGIYKRESWMKTKNQWGENNHMWKGENVDYFTKHRWLTRCKGKPKFCEACGTENAKRYEWASTSGEYKKNPDEYIRLCSSCHHIFDNLGQKMKETRIKNGTWFS